MVNWNASSTSSTRLLEWSLGAFHTSLFFWLFTIILYLAGILGNLLASLNTLVGVIVFVFLWATTWFSTRLVVRRIVDTADWRAGKIPWRKTLALATFGGGINGLVFFLVPLLLAAIVAAIAVVASRSLTDVASLLFAFSFSAVIGSVLAFLIGAVFGLLFALLDLLLLGGSQALFWLNAEEGNDKTRQTEDEDSSKQTAVSRQ